MTSSVLLLANLVGCSVDCVYSDELDSVGFAPDGSAAFVGLVLGHFGGCDGTVEAHAITLGADANIDDETSTIDAELDTVAPPNDFDQAYGGGAFTCEDCTITVAYTAEDFGKDIVPGVVTVARTSNHAGYTVLFADEAGTELASTEL